MPGPITGPGGGGLEDDGLYLPEIKPHSLEKIRLHNRYAEVFSAAMCKKWPQRAYIGLYSGAGRARISGTNEIVETSALAVLRQATPFTHYVFVDANSRCTEALSRRISALGLGTNTQVICRDVNSSASEVKSLLPPYSAKNGLLSFCFVDPFDLRLRFQTIRELSAVKLDLMILLMLAGDGRRNLARYLNNPSSTRVADFLDAPNWREEYRQSGSRKVIQYLLTRFDASMKGLGYLPAAEDVHPVKVQGKGVLLYMLAFYSKNELGRRFWRESRAALSPQLDLL